jgi:dipeptidase
MKRKAMTILAVLAVVLGLGHSALTACTNLLVTKGASLDGSVMITYSADSHTLYGELVFSPAGKHLKEGEMLDIYDWDSGKYLGKIKQAEETFAVVGNMNEFQVAIGETTFGGREELQDKKGIVDYGSLMYIALQRARTARKAIEIMGELVARYGYASSGESFSIADKNEAWIMDMIGKGEGNMGAAWVAVKVPDGLISAHANQSRIRRFPLNDKLNCLYAPDVISFAREKGYFKGIDAEFSFADAYAPADFESKRFCEARVWSLFNRAAPSLRIPTDYVKGIAGAEPIPMWVKPDKLLTVRDTMQLMRDHFEGTEFDMSKDVGAGPFQLPYRWRPLTWKVDGKEYLNERAISTQQTGFSFVTQSRSKLPDPIGGVFWFGFDDTFCTVYVPMYCGIKAVPKTFGKGAGSFREFSWDSAWWVFNFVSNYTYTRYMDMIQDVQKVQRELEGKFMADQPEVERTAIELLKTSADLARNYLTDYSVKQGDETTARWKKLGEFLIWKYLEGNVRDEFGQVQHPPYPDAWYRTIVERTGEKLKVPEKKETK